MIYLDPSALVKLLVSETESTELIAWLGDHADESPVSSDLARVEVMRAVTRLAEPGLLADARTMLDGLDTLPITESVIAAAETIGPPTLRPLDAIHLAAASALRTELSTFVAYDTHLFAAAADIGLTVAAPGA